MCWVYNQLGQLGDGTLSDRDLPVKVAGLSSATSVVAGYQHTCALLQDQSVSCGGDNTFGQVGDGTTSTRSVPATVANLSGVRSLALGYGHTCALLATGRVSCWGSTAYGVLGNGVVDPGTVPVPIEISAVQDVSAIAAGYRHSCSLGNDGKVRCWGGGSLGQLGTGSYPASQPVPSEVLLGAPATDIRAGYEFTCALRGELAPMCWGDNASGQLGTGAAVQFQEQPAEVVGLSSTDDEL